MGTRKLLRVRYNGGVYDFFQLAELANLPKSVVYDRWKRAGRPRIMTDHLLRPIAPERIKNGSATTKKAGEFQAGSWERVHLANAGNNGFCKVERGNFAGSMNRGGQSMPVYTG